MKKTYISPAVRITEADLEAALAAGSFVNTISDTDEVGGTSENGGTWAISSKQYFYDEYDEDED